MPWEMSGDVSKQHRMLHTAHLLELLKQNNRNLTRSREVIPGPLQDGSGTQLSAVQGHASRDLDMDQKDSASTPEKSLRKPPGKSPAEIRNPGFLTAADLPFASPQSRSFPF